MAEVRRHVGTLIVELQLVLLEAEPEAHAVIEEALAAARAAAAILDGAEPDVVPLGYGG